MQIHELKSPKGSRKKKRIVGRGQGSGRGKTSTRGENGQRARTGRWKVGGSEGGQMPLIRRLAKVGFNSKRPILNQIVQLKDLDCFESGEAVNAKTLKEKGLINSLRKPYKILNRGDIAKALVIETESVSKTAKEKILKAGGKIEAPKKVDTTKKKAPKTK